MANNGFLGKTPSEVLEAMRQQQMVLEEKRRSQRASNPMTHGASSLGNLAGKGIGKLFGLGRNPEESPEYKKAKDIQTIVSEAKGRSKNSKEFYKNTADALSKRGYNNEAMEALNRYKQVEQQELENYMDMTELNVKQRKATTGEKAELRKEQWNADYLKYLYDNMKAQIAKGRGSPQSKIANFKVSMWESKVNNELAKEMEKGNINVSADKIAKMPITQRMELLSDKGLENIAGYVYNDDFLQRFISPSLLTGQGTPGQQGDGASMGAGPIYDPNTKEFK